MGGSRANQHPQQDEEEELEAPRPISFGEEERYMVTGVLSLAERSIRTIMTPRSDMAWIDVNDSVEEIRAVLQREPHSLFPVCDGDLDEIIGVVKARDLLFALNEGQSLAELARQNDPIIVPQTINVIRLLAELRKARGSLILVADEFGIIQGLVTNHDLLEAIVGEPLAHSDLQPLLDDFPIQPPQPARFEAWRDLAVAGNAERAAQRRAVEVAAQGIEKQRAGHLPTLSLVASSRLTLR